MSAEASTVVERPFDEHPAPGRGRRRRGRGRGIAIVLAIVVAAGAGYVWMWSPLPTARWRVTSITVDGTRLDPLDSYVTTSTANITFHGCNEVGATVGGLPWHPRFGTMWSTAVGCLGPSGDLDQAWYRLTHASVTFDGAWATTATLRGGDVVIRLTR